MISSSSTNRIYLLKKILDKDQCVAFAQKLRCQEQQDKSNDSALTSSVLDLAWHSISFRIPQIIDDSRHSQGVDETRVLELSHLDTTNAYCLLLRGDRCFSHRKEVVISNEDFISVYTLVAFLSVPKWGGDTELRYANGTTAALVPGDGDCLVFTHDISWCSKPIDSEKEKIMVTCPIMYQRKARVQTFVRVNVGGQVYPPLLARVIRECFPYSILNVMLNTDWSCDRDEQGNLVIDSDPSIFAYYIRPFLELKAPVTDATALYQNFNGRLINNEFLFWNLASPLMPLPYELKVSLAEAKQWTLWHESLQLIHKYKTSVKKRMVYLKSDISEGLDNILVPLFFDLEYRGIQDADFESEQKFRSIANNSGYAGISRVILKFWVAGIGLTGRVLGIDRDPSLRKEYWHQNYLDADFIYDLGHKARIYGKRFIWTNVPYPIIELYGKKTSSSEGHFAYNHKVLFLLLRKKAEEI